MEMVSLTPEAGESLPDDSLLLEENYCQVLFLELSL